MEMEEIGRNLRKTRERLGLTLEEVERATRIRIHNLEAIEGGDFNSLPSSVQARGFLHNYAEFLGLEPNSILLQYAENLQELNSSRRNQTLNVKRGKGPSVEVRFRRPPWLSTDFFVAAGITIVILIVFIWGGSRLMDSLRQDTTPEDVVTEFLRPTSTIPSPTTNGTESVVNPPATSPVIAGATPTSPINIVPARQVSIQLIIEMRVWIQVTVDNQVEFEGRVLPGEILDFVAQNVVEVTTGNGAGVRVVYNGADQGQMGELGQVVSRLWTLGGILTPTPTQTKTPTPTSTETQTPIPSPTPPITMTPTDTQSAGG